ncbi:MAG: YerC/YecD family TrpR-related protein [Candidatus Colwellbacteria bacterium]|nr:YerC/YecD family TrpR-related protein [Candidatus Colwellbacteria bacterium]
MEWKSEESKKLIKAVLALESEDEAKRFLRDLMTEKEIDEFAKRLRTAEMLMENISYSSIEKETGLSSTTVSRVAKWLNREGGGYKTIIERLHHHNRIQSRRGLS